MAVSRRAPALHERLVDLLEKAAREPLRTATGGWSARRPAPAALFKPGVGPTIKLYIKAVEKRDGTRKLSKSLYIDLHQPVINTMSWRDLLTSTAEGAAQANRTVKDLLAYERVNPTFNPQSVKVRVWQPLTTQPQSLITP